MSQSTVTLTADAPLLLAAARRAPHDPLAAGMAYDALLESGLSPLAARRRVNREVREGVRDLARARVAESGRVRAELRRLAHWSLPHSVPVAVEAGDARPSLSGVPGYHEFRGGGACEFPGAAIRAGYKVDYTPDTRAVAVGVDWLIAHAAELPR